MVASDKRLRSDGSVPINRMTGESTNPNATTSKAREVVKKKKKSSSSSSSRLLEEVRSERGKVSYVGRYLWKEEGREGGS